jgi:MFS family permease
VNSIIIMRIKPGAVGSALVMPNVSAYVIDNCLPQERAQALAMRSMANDVGMLMGASTMGFVAATLGVPAAMQITAGIQAAAAVFCGLKGKMFQPKRSSAD